jgi:hypothetical protein
MRRAKAWMNKVRSSGIPPKPEKKHQVVIEGLAVLSLDRTSL